MAKKEKAATKKEKGMLIYLAEDGNISKIEEGNEVILFGNNNYIIVAHVNDNVIDKLRLYKEKHYDNFEVTGALMDAFEFDCRRSVTCFLEELDSLRETFLKKVESETLRKAERTEIKKFMYATYIKAKEMLK